MRRSDAYLRFIQTLPIRTRDLRIIPFRLNRAQRLVYGRHLAPLIDAGRPLWVIILKARRLGMSTLIEALMLARAVLEENVHALVMASKYSNTMEIWNMAKLMYEGSPLRDLGLMFHKELFFGKSKYRVSTAGTPDAQRGFDLTVMHGSEVAFWPKPETWLATVQCLPDHFDSWCFLESTANGKVGTGKLLFDEWNRAVRGKNGFTPIFLPWFAQPENCLEGVTMLAPEVDEGLRMEEEALVTQFHLTPAQMAWRRKVLAEKCQGDVLKFHQEYPATADEAFVTSGLPFFPATWLLPLQRDIEAGTRYRLSTPGKVTADPQGPLTVFRHPEDGHRYLIGGDSSMGIEDASRSKSTMQVIDQDTLEQVAEYEAAAAPHVFGPHMVGVGRYYHEAMLAPEVQASGGGGGHEVLKFIKELGYWKLYRHRHIDHKKEKTELIGWETSVKTRPRMLARIRKVVQERCATIHSQALLTQLYDLGESSASRTEALTGHDDLVFAWGIALVAQADEAYTHPVTGKDVLQEMQWEHLGLRTMKDVDYYVRKHQAALKPGVNEPDSYLVM